MWRDRIKKIKEAGCNLISTYIPWIWHENEEGNFDFQGRITPERDLKFFIELVKDEGLYLLVRPGPYIMSEIKNEGLPHWIYEKYPQVIAKKQNGENHPTRVVSYMHPDFLKKVDDWYREVSKFLVPMQVTKDGPIVMFQLDNEVGMLHWVTGQGDFSDITLDYFVKYLKSKYSIEDLKEIFNIVSYDEAKEIVKNPSEEVALKVQNEYMLFMREYFKEYLKTIKEIAAKYGVEVPFVINIHGFDMVEYAKRGKNYPIGLSQLYKTAEIDDAIIAGDYYIGNIVYDNFSDITLSNAFTLAIQSPNQPLFSAEFQGGFQINKPKLQPSTFDLTSRLCIANGMNAINYYMFVGGENYENIGLLGRRHDWQAPVGMDGSLRRHYYVIKHLSKIINAFEKELLESKPIYNTYLGFYPDYYMTEYSNEYTRNVYSKIKHFRDCFLFDGIGKGLALNNITFGGYDVKKEGIINPNEVSSLWVLSTEWMEEDVQRRLVQYVEDGGTLVLFPSIPTKDLKGNPSTLLKDYIDVDIKEKVEWNFVSIDDIDSISTHYAEVYEGKGIVPFGYIDDASGRCCAFEKRIGKGKVIVCGAGFELEQEFKIDVVKRLAERAGVKPLVKTDEFLDVWIRKNPNEDTKFLFINNYDDFSKSEKIVFDDKALFDGHKISVNPRSGLMLPLDFKLKDDCKLVYSTCEIIERDEKSITVKTMQNLEIIKFTKKVKIQDGVDFEILEDFEGYKYIFNNCKDMEIKIFI